MLDAIHLEVFKHLFASVAEEMGVALRRSSYSPNIKERRDFSCALFDAHGQMIAQAAHIPVHLGAMPCSVQAALAHFGEDGCTAGDVLLLNDPFQGGTHLPDITLITPIFAGDERIAFVANRAHHADIGGISPGSMPLSTELYQEGLIIPPLKLVEGGRLNQGVWDLVLANVRTPQERAGDLRAQLAANRKGEARLLELAQRYGRAEVIAAMTGLLAYAEQMTRALIVALPDGVYRFSDVMDDDGHGSGPLTIAVAIAIRGDQAHVDFSGTAPQCRGSINATAAITLSAVYYAFRCLIGLDIPANSGCMRPISVEAPPGSLVNARRPAAVAGGNVETSQRITDVLLAALAQAAPDRVPAASQGTMNNLTIGGWDAARDRAFAYYETIGGGMGARPDRAGAAAIHTHMTNTLNTPAEALEYAYPLRLRRYEIRRGSGGKGRYGGGDGIVREVELLTPAQVTLLSDRRRHPPYGLAGGEPGQTGRNLLIRQGETHELPGKISLEAATGDILRIETPGGGGWGPADDPDPLPPAQP